MSKKMRYLLLVLVLIVPLALAACGDDDDDEGGSNNGDSVNLSQTFESEAGITVKYPEGWAAAEEAGQVMLASSADALERMQNGEGSEGTPSEGEVGMVVMAVPLSDLGMGDDANLDSVLEMMVGAMTGEGMTTDGDTEEIKLGDIDARKVNVTDEQTEGDGFIIAYVDGDNNFIMLIGVTAQGERDQFDDTGVAIAETIEYTAPAAAG